MSKFGLGSRVTIRKPQNVDEHPHWIPEMNPLDGTTSTVIEIPLDNLEEVLITESSKPLCLNVKWVTPAGKLEKVLYE